MIYTDRCYLGPIVRDNILTCEIIKPLDFEYKNPYRGNLNISDFLKDQGAPHSVVIAVSNLMSHSSNIKNRLDRIGKLGLLISRDHPIKVIH